MHGLKVRSSASGKNVKCELGGLDISDQLVGYGVKAEVGKPTYVTLSIMADAELEFEPDVEVALAPAGQPGDADTME